jgi:cell division protein FtsB
MAENKIKRILYSRWFVFFSLLAFIWLGLVLTKTIYKKYQLSQEIESLKVEIAKMDKKEQDLTKLIDYLGSQDSLEKEAREKLNLKKEGESVLMVSETDLARELSDSSSQGPAASNEEKLAEENNLVKWWKFFFKR